MGIHGKAPSLIRDTQFDSQNGRKGEKNIWNSVWVILWIKVLIIKKDKIYLHCLLVGKCRIILHFLLQEINCLLLFQSSTCSLNKVYHKELTGLKLTLILMNNEKMTLKSNWNSYELAAFIEAPIRP